MIEKELRLRKCIGRQKMLSHTRAYKVGTHRRAVNVARAYCLRSRDEPFSRATARLTGRGAVNRTPGGSRGK